MEKVISYPCKIDDSMQKATVYFAKSKSPRPLLTALHTWSFDHTYGFDKYISFCIENDWHMIFPDFRGPNYTPQACGSNFVVSDIEDAAEYMKKTVAVDEKRIYLAGGSGGGHCSLLMAGRRPDLWTAVSAWSPITDIAAWHKQSVGTEFERYAEHIELACGGVPSENANVFEECRKRSPLTYLANAANLVIDISSGIHDGHIGSVQISHSLNAFNLLAAPGDRISEEDIEYMVKNEKVPPHLQTKIEQDPAFNGREIYFRRQSNNVRLTLFEGGHELLPSPALQWLAKQQKSSDADWSNGIAAENSAEAELSH